MNFIFHIYIDINTIILNLTTAEFELISSEWINLHLSFPSMQIVSAPEPAPTKRKRGDRDRNKKPTGRTVIAEFDATNGPVLPKGAKAKYVRTCGVIARDRVPINIEDWRKVDRVDKTLKDNCWTELLQSFEFPEGSHAAVRRHALMTMGKSWSGFKYELNRDYVKKNKLPFKDFGYLKDVWDDFVAMKRSEEGLAFTAAHTDLQKHNKFKHHLGSGGYAGKIAEWERMEDEWESAGIPNPLAGLPKASTVVGVCQGRFPKVWSSNL